MKSKAKAERPPTIALAFNRKFSAAKVYRPWVPMEQWKVLIKDRLPADSSWDQYMKNRERIEQNRNGSDTQGVVRNGAALLPGVLVCGNCNRHMQPSYHANDLAHYPLCQHK